VWVFITKQEAKNEDIKPDFKKLPKTMQKKYMRRIVLKDD
jgi:hypothetical protein